MHAAPAGLDDRGCVVGVMVLCGARVITPLCCLCGVLLCVQGKNKPTRRHKKKQTNIIEEKKPEVLKRMREEVSEGRRGPAPKADAGSACTGAQSRA